MAFNIDYMTFLQLNKIEYIKILLKKNQITWVVIEEIKPGDW